MPSSPYIEVSQETRARIAEIRRRASAAEGRTVTNDEIVSQLIDAAEGRITGTAELFEGPKGMQFTVSIGIPEARILGAADPEREARRAMIEYLEGLD
ncbi:MAG: hypothetical protein J5I35_02260 [Methanothrix harundinacea]|nr:hypothetical protein [Methanothrix harundinacea]